MNHDITIVRSLVTEQPVAVTAEGHVTVPEGAGEDILDVIDVSLSCSVCGLLGADEFAAHGLSEYWEEV